MRCTRLTLVAAVAATVAVLAACGPLPEQTPEPTSSASATAATDAPTATPTPTADAGFAVPSDCAGLYSAGMYDDLRQSNPPLNDPAITIYATENVTALEILTSGIPTIRCSWGVAGEPGLVTNVSAVSAAESEQLLSAFSSSGMACSALADGTVCRIESETIDRDDNIVRIGETQFVGGGGWVATHWVDFAPSGYTEDIVSTLWPASLGG